MKNYKIAVAGTGYVGLSIATLLSQHHQVTAVDIVPEKVEKAFVGAGKKNGKNFTVQVHENKLAAYEDMFYGIGGLSKDAAMVAIQ